MPRDADSDFAELNPLDDVDVSDQLIRKKEVGCWGVGVEVQMLELCGDEWGKIGHWKEWNFDGGAVFDDVGLNVLVWLAVFGWR